MGNPLWDTEGQSVLVLAEDILTFTLSEFRIWDVGYLADILKNFYLCKKWKHLCLK